MSHAVGPKTTVLAGLCAAIALGSLAMTGCAPSSNEGDDEDDWEQTAEDDGALRVCAEGPTVEGIDVSYYQEVIDWQKVKDAGIGFAIVRQSYGSAFDDPKFKANWAGAKQAGLVRGLYQYFRPGQDPHEQAAAVLDALADDPLGEDDLPVVMDVESTDGVSNATLRARMQSWLDDIEHGTGKKPIIYTAAFMQSNVGAGFAGYPLWVANYTTNCPLLPNGWTGWNIWQYSESGTVAGVPGHVDRDRFNGSMDDLLAFAHGTATTPDDPPPDPPDPPPPPPEVPGAPTGLSPAQGAHVTTDSVTLRCNTFPGASQYTFDIEYYSPSSHSWKAYYQYVTSSPNKTFWPVTDAPYRFRVRAKKNGTWTPYSNKNAFAYGSSTLP